MQEDSVKQTREDNRRYWEDRLKAWDASGLSQAAFCRLEGINYRNFGYWKRRLSEASGVVAFAPILATRSFAPCSLRVVLENGCRIDVGPGFDAVTLREVVTVMRGL